MPASSQRYIPTPHSVLVIGILCRGQQHVFSYGPLGTDWQSTPDGEYGVGFDWLVSRWSDDTSLLHWHDGATGGYSSFLGMLRTQEVGVVVLTNHGPDSFRRRN